jgi:hypothetical protein
MSGSEGFGIAGSASVPKAWGECISLGQRLSVMNKIPAQAELGRGTLWVILKRWRIPEMEHFLLPGDIAGIDIVSSRI